MGQLKDTQTAFLPHLVSLTALDLSYCRNLTAEGLQQLVWLTQLHQLNLMAIGNDELSCLKAFRQLTGLTVSFRVSKHLFHLVCVCLAWFGQ